MLAGVDQRPWDAPVLQNSLRPVDILQEEIERHHALAEAALDVVPLLAGKDSRRQVEGEETLGATAVAIDGEGDALQEEREIGELPALFELAGGHGGQFLINLGVMRPGNAIGGEHLVEKRAWIVVSEETVFPSHLGRLWQCRQYSSGPARAPINCFLGTDLKYFESLTNPQVTVALDVIH